MKSLKFAVLLAALPLAAAAQDPVKVDPGHYKLLVDNATVRVLKVSSPSAKRADALAPRRDAGAAWPAKARFTLPDGKTQDMESVKEVAAYTPAGTHSPANVGTTPVDAILVEFKAKTARHRDAADRARGRPDRAARREPARHRVQVDRRRGLPRAPPARRTSTTRSWSRSARPTCRSRSRASRPTTKWQRGDAEFIGRGVKHESKNTSGKPIEFIIVMIK